jgi:hypothetical protein
LNKFVDFVTRHKCIVTQGAAFVNMGIIFFVGGVHIQMWIERHFGVSINVAVPVVVAVGMSWLIGYVMLKAGMIRSEQTFYTMSRSRRVCR